MVYFKNIHRTWSFYSTLNSHPSSYWNVWCAVFMPTSAWTPAPYILGKRIHHCWPWKINFDLLFHFLCVYFSWNVPQAVVSLCNQIKPTCFSITFPFSQSSFLVHPIIHTQNSFCCVPWFSANINLITVLS